MPKKKTALTIEERLQQALVPAEEQPYEVPENWVWTYWKICGDLIAGSGFKKEFQEKKNLPIPFYKVGSLKFADNLGFLYDDENTIDEPIRNVLKATLIKEHSVIFAKIGEAIRLNRRAVNTEKCCIDNNLMAFTVNDMVLWRYAYFWTLGLDLYSYTNSTTVPAIRKSDIELINFPLPPLSEQQRIVERIEELFAKLDEAKERLQEVADSFAVRKAAILHKAFTGELTKQWRLENGVSDESWEDVSLDSVCKSIYDGDHMPPPKSETGIPFLVISNVNTGFISFEKCRFVPEEYYDGLSETRTPEIGDILYTIVGSYGIPVMVDTDKKFCFQRHMALLKPKDIYNRFLWRQLQTQSFFEQATSIATGTAQLTVPIKGLRKLIVKCPTLPEQHEIVRLIDDLLARERSAQQATEQALASIDLMKKSILARAFRGELGTNKASEASALELLKQVLAEG